jgi:hypothetical protein
MDVELAFITVHRRMIYDYSSRLAMKRLGDT